MAIRYEMKRSINTTKKKKSRKDEEIEREENIVICIYFYKIK